MPRGCTGFYFITCKVEEDEIEELSSSSFQHESEKLKHIKDFNGVSEATTSKDKRFEQSTARDASAQQGGQKRPQTDEVGKGTTDPPSKLEVQNQNCGGLIERSGV
ncbi:unnamed protein product [Urochloa humidicola]